MKNEKPAAAPKNVAPMHEIQHVRLEEFEHVVYSRKHEAAANALIGVFRQLRTGAEFAFKSISVESRPPLFARLASAITALLTDPEFQVSDDGYSKLLIEHGVIEAIFEASAFDTSDHLARLFSENPEERDASKLRFSPYHLALWLLCWCSSSRIEIDFEQLFSRDKKIAAVLLPYWAALLGQSCVLSKSAWKRREALLHMGRYFEDLEIPAIAIAPIGDAYMYSSYGTSDDRHDVKGIIIKMLRRSLLSKTPAIPPESTIIERRAAGRGKKRPTMVVPLEWFGSFHAMYRCYAPLMRELAKRFRLVAIGRGSAFDETSKKVFDEVITLSEEQLNLEEIITKIDAHKPDILYYPSLGMAMQWVALASIRLAPIQVMTLGHPATSMSPAMDYILMDDGSFSDASLFSERVALLPNYVNVFDRRPDMPPRRLEYREQAKPDVVDFAVPAMACKLNAPFMEVLVRIRNAALERGVKTRFHFFPSQLGVLYYQMRKHLLRWLPESETYPRADYAWYMQRLGEADAVLVPFPFGGTNSTVDSFWLGLPVVTLLGAQPHSRFDALLLERVGLGAIVAKTVDEYVDVALNFLDSGVRRQLFDGLAAVDLERELFVAPAAAAGHGEIYGRCFSHLFRNHEAIQASPDRTIRWQEYGA